METKINAAYNIPVKKINRWNVAVAGIVMQLCLGTVYGWSVFTKPLEAGYNWSRTEVTLAFTIAIGFLGLATVLGGAVLDRKGPKTVATLGAVLFGAGTVFTGVAVKMESLALIYVTYGVICGLGIGFGYITPISTLVKWFPDKRGLITGLSVMGFGAGAFLMTVFTPGLISSFGVSAAFYLLGVIFLVLTFASARLLDNPPEGFKPEGWQPAGNGEKSGMTLAQAVRTRHFWFFWIILFLNVSAGIALISQASPMVQETFKQTAAQAGFIIGIFSIFNGLGRLFWSAVSDYIGRRTVFILLFATQAVVFLIMPHIGNLVVFVILSCYIYACYGGGFATMPAFSADTFGTRHIGSIYGWILTAWSAAGIAGPVLYSYIRQTSKSYSSALTVTGAALVAALAFPLLIGRKPDY